MADLFSSRYLAAKTVQTKHKENRSIYLHDAWTLDGSLETNKLYLQLLPVYTWAKEGTDMDRGLSDVQIMKIGISEMD